MPPETAVQRVRVMSDGRRLTFPANTPDEVVDAFEQRILSSTTPEHFAVDPNTRFEAPETVGGALLRGAKAAARTVLPALGLVGGGMLAGGPANPPGAVLGAGLGYAAGEQATRILESVIAGLTGTPQAPQPGLADQLLRTGKDVLTGGALEAAPAALLAAPRAARGLLGIGEATPADLLVRQAAERQGIPLTAGAASGSASVARIESVPGQFPLGRSTSEPAMEATRRDAIRAAERLLDDLGGTTSLETAGLAIKRDVAKISRAREHAPTTVLDAFIARLGPQGPSGRLGLGASVGQGLREFEKGTRMTSDVAYAEAYRLAPADAAVTASSTNALAREMSGLQRRLENLAVPAVKRAATSLEKATTEMVRPSDLPDAALTDLIGTGRVGITDISAPIPVADLPQAFIQQYGLATVKSIPLDLAIELQKRLRSLARHVMSDDDTKRRLGDLGKAITADIEAFGLTSGGDLGTKLTQASTLYRDEVARFFAPRKPLRKLMDADPGAIAERLLTTKSPDLLTAALEHLPPRQHQEVRRAFMERVRQQALDPRTGEVSPEKLARVLDTIGEENLGIVLGPRLRELNGLRGVLAARPPQHKALDDVMSGAAERVILNLTKGHAKSVDDLTTVWGSISKPTQGEVRQALFSDVLERSVDKTTNLPSLERFMTAKNDIAPAVWDMIFTQDQHAALRDLSLVFQRINTFQRAAANPSQTGMTLLGTGQIVWGAGLLGSTAVGREDPESFLYKLAGLFSPYMIGKAVFSRAGQRMLTSPAPSAGGGGPTAADVILRTLGVSAMPRQREEAAR